MLRRYTGKRYLFHNYLPACDFLLSDEGKKAIVDLHVQGINEYVLSLSAD